MYSEETPQPYGDFVAIDENIWTLDGDWYDTPFRRRMTIVKLSCGELVVHSAIRLKESDYSKINSFGKVGYIIVPNNMHSDDAPFFKIKYPDAKLFVPRASLKKVSKFCTVDGVLPGCWPKELEDEMKCIEFKGTRILEEQVFFHISTKTLIAADLVFNMTNEPTGLMKTFFKWNKIYKRFGPSRIFKWVFISNLKVAERSFGDILTLDFDRVVMSHGDVLDSNGQSKFREGLKDLGIST